jgi:hypothetical protein
MQQHWLSRNASLSHPTSLKCGSARLSGSRSTDRASYFSSKGTWIFLMTTGSSLQSAIQLTVAITYDSNSNVHLALTTNNRTIHADSSTSNRSLLYSPLESTKIIQSLILTDAITDNSYSNEHLDSSK